MLWKKHNDVYNDLAKVFFANKNGQNLWTLMWEVGRDIPQKHLL